MRTFDSVVLGTGIAGCAAAALLAKAGKRVLLIGPSKETDAGMQGSAFFRNGVRDRLDCSYGFDEGGAWRAILRDLNIDDRISSSPAFYQVALPDRRITVSADPRETLRELRREYSGEMPAVERFYQESADLARRMEKSRLASYAARHRSAGDMVGRYHFSRELQAFLSASSYFFFDARPADLSQAEIALLMAKAPRVIDQGFEGLLQLLRDVVRQNGSEYVETSAWSDIRIRTDRNRVTGISHGQEEISCGSILLNTTRPGGRRTYVSIIKKDVVPVGMLELVLAVPDYERPEDVAAVSLARAPSDGPVTAGAMMLQVHWRDAEVLGPDVSRTQRRIESLVPFLDEFTLESRLLNGSDRSVTLPANVTERPDRKGRGAGPGRFTAKNLFLLEDSVFGVGRSALAVRAAVGGMT